MSRRPLKAAQAHQQAISAARTLVLQTAPDRRRYRKWLSPPEVGAPPIGNVNDSDELGWHAPATPMPAEHRILKLHLSSPLSLGFSSLSYDAQRRLASQCPGGSS